MRMGSKGGATQKKKKTVLIVEDERDLRDIYAFKFEKEGYIVHKAENGVQALEILEQEPATAIILLDLIMPKMGGFQLLQILKRDKSYSKIPVFILSNLSQEHEIDEGLRLQADKYLIKAHYTPEEIVTKVKQYLK